MGLPADLQVIADGMISASMEMVTTVMPSARDTAIAVSHELDRQHGMAGDDDAGHAFAKVYGPAAAETLDQTGFSAYVLGETGRGLMRSAREFIAQDDSVAAALMARQPDPVPLMGDPAQDCEESFIRLGEQLQNVVGSTSFSDQYLGFGSDGGRFRGSPDKLRDVAGTWTRAGTLLEGVLTDAQACAHAADKAHSGQAADAFRAYFAAFVGFGAAPALAQPDETLVANLVAACDQLAKACLQYADHIDTALAKIRRDSMDPSHGQMPWNSPVFGGNGDDGGLRNLVLDDPWIHALGDVAHALDTSQARVKLPRGADPDSRPWYEPWFPLPEFLPEPAPLVLASYGRPPSIIPAIYVEPDPTIPWRAPVAPAAGTTQPLRPADRQAFQTWVDGLDPQGFGNGRDATDPANAYQLRISGYPERKIPILDGDARKAAIGADGMRSSDGYVVEAKHVENRDNCYRVGDTLQLLKEKRPDGKPKSSKGFLVDMDREELVKYHLALDQHQQIRGLEIDTDYPDSVAYWQTLMTEQGIKGIARYKD